jgi:hypothetical protein
MFDCSFHHDQQVAWLLEVACAEIRILLKRNSNIVVIRPMKGVEELANYAFSTIPISLLYFLTLQ